MRRNHAFWLTAAALLSIAGCAGDSKTSRRTKTKVAKAKSKTSKRSTIPTTPAKKTTAPIEVKKPKPVPVKTATKDPAPAAKQKRTGPTVNAGLLQATPLQLAVFLNHRKHILLDGRDSKGRLISSEAAPAPDFKVLSKPEHGTITGTAPRLIYRAKPGYTGPDRITFRVSQNGIDSPAATVNLTVGPWTPPAGVPAPPFGIKESHRMYEKARFDFGSGPIAYPTGTDGPYTHYVDPSHKAATDENNPYGTPEAPRFTIPKEIPAGSVVEVHGVIRVKGKQKYKTIQMVGKGTADRPVFVRGTRAGKRPVIEVQYLRAGGSHFIIENFEMVGTSINTGKKSTAHRLVLRNNEIHHHLRSNCVNIGGREVVAFNNYIHHTGTPDNPNDRHGLHARAGSEKVWLIDNHVHHSTGDGVQFAHGARQNGPKFVYVARNRFHHDFENAIDIKYASDVIVSENICYGYTPISRGRSGSDGSAMVLGSDGGPERIWILFNTVYDANNAIRIELTKDAWLIGNVLYNTKRDAIVLEKQGTDTRIINNTIHNVAVAISQVVRPRFGLKIHNNIFSGLRGSTKSGKHLQIESDQIIKRTVIKDNIFWNGSGPMLIEWGSKKLRVNGDALPIGTNNRRVDPRFINADAGDFRLATGSPATDAGVLHEAYAEFKELYGFDIVRDRAGGPRPTGKGWDIGAFETH